MTLQIFFDEFTTFASLTTEPHPITEVPECHIDKSDVPHFKSPIFSFDLPNGHPFSI
jgi:hypothetical protein